VFNAVKRLILGVAFSYTSVEEATETSADSGGDANAGSGSGTVAADSLNPFWKGTGYPGQ
jgi:hypothetical protein